ncbi:MAG TPA: hypothetical protein VK034_00280 [Enhygromyxa sp.]|nr:hypothetical protein [Enhygromyxa sp.]
MSRLSRRGLAVALLGLGGLGCRHQDRPDTELPTEQLGPHFRKLRRRIRKHVADRDRRAAALALVKQLDRQLGDLDRLLVEWRTDLALLPDDQREDRSAIARITRHHAQQLGEAAREAGRVAHRLRCHISAAEWPLVFHEAGLEGLC